MLGRVPQYTSQSQLPGDHWVSSGCTPSGASTFLWARGGRLCGRPGPTPGRGGGRHAAAGDAAAGVVAVGGGGDGCACGASLRMLAALGGKSLRLGSRRRLRHCCACRRWVKG